MKLLILGRNGQVGWELCRALAPLGEITALARAAVDFNDPEALIEAVAEAAPDIIVNAVAYTAVDKAESQPELADRVNHLAVAELGRLSADHGGWLIHYSTDYVFDGTRTEGAYAETDATGPRSVYSRSKLAGERALAKIGGKHLIFRTSWVHAARGGNFIRTMLRLAGERDTLRVVADQFGAPTSAELIADVTAHAIAAIARNAAPTSGVYHLAAAGETSWHGLAQFAIAEALEAGAALRARPEAVEAIATADYPTAAARPANSRLDTTKLRAALNLTLPDWRWHAGRTVAELVEKGTR